MKKFTKQLLFAALLMGGMQFYTSCDGCSRTDGNREGTEDAIEANGNTDGSETPADNENSGRTEGTGTSAGPGSGNNSTNEASGSTNTGAANQSLDQAQVTNEIENSDAHKVDSQGNPVRSSGSAGSGMGTGTGSTGNNSKVTSKADQLN